MAIDSREDARLVQSTLEGDRPSFEAIVLRYQNLVASITYSGTGDLALSEDLAQEAFLAAWRNLAQLREPASLRPWLAGIAKTLTANARRAMARKPASVSLPLDLEELATRAPVEHVIRQEERTLVWDALRQLPENYRKPLILFYREERSVRRVAEDLDLSEDAVKQRLSRGRQLLTERVMALVAKTLEDTKPDRTFVAGIMAGLSALAPQAVSVGMIGAGGKGSVIAKSALLGGTVSAVLGPILGLLGGLISLAVSVRSAKSPPERRVMIRVGTVVFLYVALLNILLAAAYALSYLLSMAMVWLVMSVLGLLYLGGFVWLATWAARWQRQIRVETGTDQSPEQERVSLTRRTVMEAFAGATLGSVFWILFMAIGSEDWVSVAVIAGVALVILLTSLSMVIYMRGWFYRVSIAMTLALAVLNLCVVNLRWTHWVASVVPEGGPDRQLVFPLFAVNLLLAGIFTLILTSLIHKARQPTRRRWTTAPNRVRSVGDRAR